MLLQSLLYICSWTVRCTMYMWFSQTEDPSEKEQRATIFVCANFVSIYFLLDGWEIVQNTSFCEKFEMEIRININGVLESTVLYSF